MNKSNVIINNSSSNGYIYGIADQIDGVSTKIKLINNSYIKILDCENKKIRGVAETIDASNDLSIDNSYIIIKMSDNTPALNTEITKMYTDANNLPNENEYIYGIAKTISCNSGSGSVTLTNREITRSRMS